MLTLITKYTVLTFDEPRRFMKPFASRMVCNSRLLKFLGLSTRHLPIDLMTLTEVLRLSLATSGYYTGIATNRFRLYSRGGVRFHEDDGFLFVRNNPQTMKVLEQVVQ
ncbi:unnamed protein product [Gongylonema pulchrum]|uniref:BTB_2 domain-containing protein n=1 Tax=Gongylonema pulchrum TaxID=637853 RepID=A0A183DLC7_9BILA|nr:unnamed protein product [Gongylonema pulchrum]